MSIAGVPIRAARADPGEKSPAFGGVREESEARIEGEHVGVRVMAFDGKGNSTEGFVFIAGSERKKSLDAGGDGALIGKIAPAGRRKLSAPFESAIGETEVSGDDGSIGGLAEDGF